MADIRSPRTGIESLHPKGCILARPRSNASGCLASNALPSVVLLDARRSPIEHEKLLLLLAKVTFSLDSFLRIPSVIVIRFLSLQRVL